MINQYVKAVEGLQQLFQELADSGKIDAIQADRYDESQKILISFHSWVRNQVSANSKVETPWEGPRIEQAWKLWINFKKEQFGFHYKMIGEQGALQDLAELSGGDMEKAIAIIHRSIKKGWKSFYELPEPKAITKKLVKDQHIDYKQQLMNRLGIE